MPSRHQLIPLVNSLCEIQDKVMSVKGMPKHIQQPIADKVEPLKAPMFFLWEKWAMEVLPNFRREASTATGWLLSTPLPRISSRSASSNSEHWKSPSMNMTAALIFKSRSSISTPTFKNCSIFKIIQYGTY